MLKKKKLKYVQNLMLLMMSLLTSCKQINYNYCPIYPIAGQKVAEELKKLNHDEYLYTWEWIGRINKLRQELELCK